MPTKADSLKAARVFFERLRSDEALRGKAFGAPSYEEFLRVARSQGFELSGLSEAEARSLATGGAADVRELSEEDLRKVAGGSQDEMPKESISFSYESVAIKYTSYLGW